MLVCQMSLGGGGRLSHKIHLFLSCHVCISPDIFSDIKLLRSVHSRSLMFCWMSAAMKKFGEVTGLLGLGFMVEGVV